MKILAVLAHPERDSFTGALLDAFTESATAAGHDVTVADLCAEGFDPNYNSQDAALYAGGTNIPEDVATEQERILAADAMAFFFPVWWWSMPAILKGWIDRVFLKEFAFHFEGPNSYGMLKHKKVIMFCPAACDRGLFRRYGYHQAFQRQIDAGIFGYCGIPDVETLIFPEVEDNQEARERFLEQTRAVARDFETVSGLGAEPIS